MSIHNKLLSILCLIITFLSQLTSAAPADDDYPKYVPGTIYLKDKAIALDDGYQLSVQGLLGGIVLICTGIMLSVRSVWDRTAAGRHVQNLIGFVTFGFVTWVMLANFEPAGTYGTNRLTIYFLVPFIVGLISICFMAVTIQLYIMLIGGLGGLALGLWILGWKNNLSITSNYGRAILLTVLVVVFMILALYYCFWHNLGATFAGPYIFFMGLDIFFHTGFLYCFTTTLDTNNNHAHDYVATRGVYIMQSCLIVAYIVTYVIQGFGHSHIFQQHQLVMSTLNRAEYNYKRYNVPFPAIPQFFGTRNPAPVVTAAPVIAAPAPVVAAPAAVV